VPARPGVDQPLMKSILGRLRGQVRAATERSLFYHYALPVMERALEQTDVTVWVCANDSAAIEAIEFLSRNRVRVPDDISVVGFDDGVEASLLKLTTYNFNGQAAVHAILSHVLNPGRGNREGNAPEEIEGFLVERESARRVRTER
jgi:DNA-binding LacI/PurR family transcriptional regulator